jgi:DNA-directed RNA polymerase subunit RPC12/RpoP
MYMNTSLKVPVAVRQDTGKLILPLRAKEAQDADETLKFKCPQCNDKVFPKKRSVDGKQPHFAHAARSTDGRGGGGGCGEGLLHKAAKMLLADQFHRFRFVYKCKRCPAVLEEHAYDTTAYRCVHEDAEIRWVGDRKPDAMIIERKTGKNFTALEVKHSNKVSKKKADELDAELPGSFHEVHASDVFKLYDIAEDKTLEIRCINAKHVPCLECQERDRRKRLVAEAQQRAREAQQAFWAQQYEDEKRAHEAAEAEARLRKEREQKIRDEATAKEQEERRQKKLDEQKRREEIEAVNKRKRHGEEIEAVNKRKRHAEALENELRKKRKLAEIKKRQETEHPLIYCTPKGGYFAGLKEKEHKELEAFFAAHPAISKCPSGASFGPHVGLSCGLRAYNYYVRLPRIECGNALR